MDLEVGKRDLTTFVVTETMHERKKVMFMNADAIVMLPGGAGSLDEFFEVLTWRQLGLHAKPVFLLDTRGLLGAAARDAGPCRGAGLRRGQPSELLPQCTRRPTLMTELRAAL
jgi:hypothetical protein